MPCTLKYFLCHRTRILSRILRFLRGSQGERKHSQRYAHLSVASTSRRTTHRDACASLRAQLARRCMLCVIRWRGGVCVHRSHLCRIPPQPRACVLPPSSSHHPTLVPNGYWVHKNIRAAYTLTTWQRTRTESTLASRCARCNLWSSTRSRVSCRSVRNTHSRGNRVRAVRVLCLTSVIVQRKLSKLLATSGGGSWSPAINLRANTSRLLWWVHCLCFKTLHSARDTCVYCLIGLR